MSYLLYARVSDPSQAEREFSLPAQLRLCRRYVEERGGQIADTYQDVSSGRSLKHRPGLLAAIAHARRDSTIEGIVVHKIDRAARNTLTYLTLKAQLRTYGVRIYSVVESFDPSPMGEFIEHIMAAQAEFYSANLAGEVHKGIEERLRRGLWNGMAPIGYLSEKKRLRPDPARAHFIRRAFELWATGNHTSVGAGARSVRLLSGEIGWDDVSATKKEAIR